MNDTRIIISHFSGLWGYTPAVTDRLPASGSDRRYYRAGRDGDRVIGVINPDRDENRAFTGFTRHFINSGLPVPELLYYDEDDNICFLTDLGDITLLDHLNSLPESERWSQQIDELFKRILDYLIVFQVEGIKGLDLSLCHPHRQFDNQSMLWDMNYFKYMFLKLARIPFNEKRLEMDFHELAAFLCQARSDYFLYRDFQSANIMIVNGNPFFIDYQGGRLGAPHYDAASLVFDAKLKMPEETRRILTDHYVAGFCSATGYERSQFLIHMTGFSVIRLMQALGAFGYRGLYEGKPGFADSIYPALNDLEMLLLRARDEGLKLPEMYNMVAAGLFRETAARIEKSGT
ncbi:MAG: phosphotransferase [Bacteroidales bacterium]|nr:phosphotransferase [Bacteroidales bacterium]